MQNFLQKKDVLCPVVIRFFLHPTAIQITICCRPLVALANKKTKSLAQPGTYINQAKLEENLNVQQNLIRLNEYETAVSELLKVEKQQATATALAYKTAWEAHEAAWAAFVDTLPETINEETGAVYKVIPENASTRELRRFNFQPETILSVGFLEGKVSSSTIGVVNNLALYNYANVADAVAAIEAAMQKLGGSFSGITGNNSGQTVVFNGGVWDVRNSRVLPEHPADVLYGYHLCSHYDAGVQYEYFTIELNAGYDNPTVTGGVYHATLPDGSNNTNGLFTVLFTVGNLIKLKLYPDNGIYMGGPVPIRIRGTIQLSNGNTISFDKTLQPNTCAAGIGVLTSTGQPAEEQDIIGIHQLGIADYRKVTQEVCCYVPGEVSHIENVLKGEYKERATRRLRRSEDTTETSVERETENLTDVTSTERNEMHSEVSKVLSADKSITANASASAGFGKFSFSASAGYAANTSQTDSTSQAIEYAKDVTARAMERVVQKISEKRTKKIIDEFEENNKHGLDNRGTGAANFSGVYRWVDKVYKNQLVNYGRRLMYEIMVPEPARFLTVPQAPNPAIQVLQKPTDPRTVLANAKLLNAGNYQYVAALYNAGVSPCPASTLQLSKAVKLDCSDNGGKEDQALATDVEIPEGYAAYKAQGAVSFTYHRDKMENSGYTVSIGDYFAETWWVQRSNHPIFANTLSNIEGKLSIGVRIADLGSFSMSLVVHCTRTQAAFEKWQNETFAAIMEVYEAQKAAYDKALADAQAQIAATADTSGTRYNPLQSRMVEMGELKKNCLQLMLEPFGKTIGVDTLRADGYININAAFGNHASKVRFFEAAFEWEIMSYIFYPYFWAGQDNWAELFAKEDTDPLFRSFLGAGMARVVLSVRPGFEEAVLYYLETGLINEGKDLAIDDDLYLSLLAEQLPIEGKPEGEPWETRLPTALTVLQKGSVAVTETGLPCACDTDDTGNGFESNNNSLRIAGSNPGLGDPEDENPDGENPGGEGPVGPGGPAV